MAPAFKEMVIIVATKKHLTSEDRSILEHMLRGGESIKAIAFKLDKSTSTISREIKKHSVSSNKSAPRRVRNRCIYRRNCKKFYLCEDKPDCKKNRCSTCRLCNSVCPDFVEEECPKLDSPPYVCNGCTSEHLCTLRKRYYLHRNAQKDYQETLKMSRSGFNVTEEEVKKLDEFISPLVIKGQSIHHIFVNNPNEFTCSQKSLYRYINACLFSARNIDLPRVCRLKPRRNKPREHKVDKMCRVGRSYEDFLAFLADNPDTTIVEMDSVEGKKGGSVLLTMHFKNCDFMLAFLRERNTSQSVIDVFKMLTNTLGKEDFKMLFPVILTDNGSEFSNPIALETNETKLTSIFYCDSSSPYQKPSVENNHVMIRRILPKGCSFDHLNQADINLMMNHINSYSREKLNNKSPYQSFSFLYGQDILTKLGARAIPANEIILRPCLLSK